MQCPIDDRILIDFLEEELEGEVAREVRRHTDACADCGGRLEHLRAMRGAIWSKVDSYEPPDNDFWQENLDAVGQATWQSRQPGSKLSGRRLRRVFPLVAAAAIVVLALVGTFRTGLFQTQAPDGTIANLGVEDTSTEALVDSLYMLAEIAQQYQLTYKAIESIHELGADTVETYYADAGMTYPVTGNFYDAMLNMEEEQVDQIIYVLASY